MSALELVRTAVLDVLQAADIPAAAAYSDDWAAAYEAPVLTVGVGGGGSLRVGFHDYLGEWYDEKTASYQERYGKELDVSLLLDAYAPRAVGAAGCDTLLDQVQNVLTASPPAGLRMGDMEWGEVDFDRKADLFRRRATLHCSAAFVATIQEETGLLLDFKLKGELRH